MMSIKKDAMLTMEDAHYQLPPEMDHLDKKQFAGFWKLAMGQQVTLAGGKKAVTSTFESLTAATYELIQHGSKEEVLEACAKVLSTFPSNKGRLADFQTECVRLSEARYGR